MYTSYLLQFAQSLRADFLICSNLSERLTTLGLKLKVKEAHTEQILYCFKAFFFILGSNCNYKYLYTCLPKTTYKIQAPHAQRHTYNLQPTTFTHDTVFPLRVLGACWVGVCRYVLLKWKAGDLFLMPKLCYTKTRVYKSIN